MRRIGLGLSLLVAVSVPLFLRDYWLYVIIIGLYYAILSASWSMLAGQIGLISFAHAAFSAVGAYTSALLVIKLGISIYIGMAAGSIMAALFGLGIGTLTLRMRGPYLALTTLAFSEILRIFLTAEYALTRGSYGLSVPLLAGGDKVTQFYVALGILVLTITILSIILKSRWGLFLLSMREDEIGAATRGVETVRYRLYAFIITSACAGLAGGFYAHVVGLVSPRMALISEMGLVLAMSIFGGLESFIGSALGALALQTLSEYLRAVEEWRLAVFGALVLLTLRFSPEGLLPRMYHLLSTNLGRGDKTIRKD